MKIEAHANLIGNKVCIINITYREWFTDLISSDCMMNISPFLVLFVAMHANLIINLSDKAAIHSKLKSQTNGLSMMSWQPYDKLVQHEDSSTLL